MTINIYNEPSLERDTYQDNSSSNFQSAAFPKTLERIVFIAKIISEASNGDPKKILLYSQTSKAFREASNYSGSWARVIKDIELTPDYQKGKKAYNALCIGCLIQQNEENELLDKLLLEELLRLIPTDFVIKNKVAKFAIKNEKLDSLKTLLKDCFPYYPPGNNFLDVAASEGSKKSFEFLVENCPDLELSQNILHSYILLIKGPRALHWAVENNLEDSVRTISMRNPKKALEGNEFWENPLHLAAQYGHENILRILLQACPEAASKHSRLLGTPMHYAAYYGNINCLHLLLEKVPNTAIQETHGGLYPLNLAAKYGHENCLQLLMEKDYEAALNTKIYEPSDMDFSCKSALELAIENGHEDCVNLLKKTLQKKDLQQ